MSSPRVVTLLGWHAHSERMDREIREPFLEVEGHVRELSERQGRVLNLVCDGYSNLEIAEALGISLDGAKWNVSEILTKLGLESREQAADFWRWRNRRGRRFGWSMAWWLGWGAAFKAVGATALVVVVGLGAMAAWRTVRVADARPDACDPDARARPLPRRGGGYERARLADG